MKNLINLIIAGVGGQGVNVLARVLAEVCLRHERGCQYTVHKGGAQSLGTVYAELRVSEGRLPILGAGIPRGKLDALVALDPWEAMRHLPLAHAATAACVETEIMPLFADRASAVQLAKAAADPVQQLRQLPLSIVWRQYRRDAGAQHGTPAMANYLAGLDCLQALGINDRLGFDQVFFNTVSGVKNL